MKSRFVKLVGLAALLAVGASPAFGQAWGDECIDPMNTTPYTSPYDVVSVGNNLMIAATQAIGQATYGDTDSSGGPCFSASVTIDIGGTGFMSGLIGSVQDTNPADPTDTFIDDFLIYNFGMPDAPGRPFNKAAVTVNGAQGMLGSAGFGYFVGASRRYYQINTTLNNVGVELTVDVIGDAARLTWDLTNLDAANNAGIGLWWGQTLGMLSNSPDVTGSTQSFARMGGNNGRASKPGYVFVGSGRPPILDTRYVRALNPSSFPAAVQFLFGQTAAYGLQVDNGPTDQTKDSSGNSDATSADEFLISDQAVGSDPNAFADGLTPDTGMLSGTSYIQKFAEEQVLPGGVRRIRQYFRTTWGNGNYAEPYTAVVDAPRLVASDPNGLNGLSPNPMTIRVYVDNAQSFATANQSIALQDVRIRLTFPGTGIALAAGEPANGEKVIAQINPRNISFVDYQVEATGEIFGDLPYQVEVNSTPGGRKIITGTIRVSATPRIDVVADANLVTIPWRVDDTSWEAILGLQSPEDFRVYDWDPQQNGYIPSTSARRSVGSWVVANGDYGLLDIQQNPTAPADIPTGAPNIQLKSGWNLIGNPYPYAILLSQLVGAPSVGSAGSLTWAQLLNAGYVGAALAYYDTSLGDYAYVQGNEAVLFPHRGYWVYLNTQDDLTLSFPPVYAQFLPGAGRSLNSTQRWVQNDKNWRLQLAVRSARTQDSQNFVGFASSAAEVKKWQMAEVPTPPTSDVSLAIEGSMNGRTTRMAQSYGDKVQRKEWKVVVNANDAGTYTVSWPNLSTVPKNMRFRLTDVASGTVRDLRQTSSYTFTTDGPSTREFKIEVTPGGTAKAVIGNVVVARPSRSPLAPFSIRYTLSNDASTSVRVLSGSGKEVFTVHRGRADRTGENEVQWALRDNANRLVAPGSYRVEILAETSEGERVRKIVPVNVIR